MADNYEDYSKEQLLRLLRERDRRPNFGLVWERDEIDHDLSVNNDFVALDWEADLSCGDGPQDNLIIEGDNFDALRTLRMTHAGRVKCIYIDPPYNTGNRDFIYNDRFIDKEDSYRHSKWLEFIYRRLELAKELLTEDGVIFVSIDDNEVFHLGLLMEQIFGASNFIANLIWKRKAGGGDDSDHIATEHEYVLCYALNVDQAHIARIQHESPAMTAKYNKKENGRRYYLERLDKTSLTYSQSMDFPIDCPDGTKVSPSQPDPNNPTTSWRWGEKTVGVRREELIFVKEKKTGIWRIYTRTWEPTEGVTPRSLLVEKEHGRNRDGTQELAEYLGPRVFNNPKPTKFIQHLLSMGAKDKNAIVLDFFAGSGTTAQAVMNLNREDGGNRRYILVSSTEATPETPDKNLCRDVCAERVRRVITGYTNKKGESVTGLGGGFAYLRCRRIPAATVFRGIQHAQIWTALQLIHDVALSPYQACPSMQIAQGRRGLVIYLPKINDAVLDALHTAVQAVAQAVVYSWQPALLVQRLADSRLAFEPIPAFLVNRFGARSTAKGGRP
jgi:adenine-specific DNA-methyltransferase